MLIADTVAAIERIAPPAHQAAWDKSGIQIASEKTEIAKAALSLDPTPDNIERALAENADILVTHHPLTLEPRLPATLDAYHRALSLCIKHDLWLYAAHTSLDVQPRGPAGWLARELSLAGARVLEVTATGDDGTELGYGQVGDLPAPLSPTEFLARLGALLPRIAMRKAGHTPSAVSRVAYCPGSGAQLAALAKKSGADVFVTGDVRYHAALDAADTGILLIDAGHFSLEEEMTRRLADCLAGAWEHTGPEVVFLPSRDPFDAVAAHP